MAKQKIADLRQLIERDNNYSLSEDERHGDLATKLLTRDEARRIAANIAKLPGIAAKLANKHLCVCVRRLESVLPPGD